MEINESVLFKAAALIFELNHLENRRILLPNLIVDANGIGVHNFLFVEGYRFIFYLASSSSSVISSCLLKIHIMFICLLECFVLFTYQKSIF